MPKSLILAIIIVMKRKIFISINVPEKIRKRLVLATDKWQDLPIKWVKEPNLHVTLFFLGYLDDETTRKVCETVAETVKNYDIFDINFNEITLAPEKDPRMVWLIGEPSDTLLKLYEEIEKGLGIFISPKKSFRPHITLGRIRKNKWEDLENAPEIKEKFALSLSIDDIDVMASHFEPSGGEYALIEKCPLK